VTENVIDLWETAVSSARAAGELIRARWSQPRQVKNKGFRDLVTETDLAAQKLITGTIREIFPEHGFLTEEADGDLPANGPVIWVIDPVDGTTNFSRSVPTFCVSIAAVSNANELLAGAVYDPMRDEMFSAARDQGAWLQSRSGEQRPLTVSTVNTLSDALLALDWSRKPDLRRSTLDVLVAIAPLVHYVQAIGAAALALSWLAAGRVDGYFHWQLSPWDLAAACLIIQEAGGQISRPNGQPWHYSTQNSGIMASNGRLHQTILDHVTTITQFPV
jgi:myo-inositol-1(or 4)-monophosphatase